MVSLSGHVPDAGICLHSMKTRTWHCYYSIKFHALKVSFLFSIWNVRFLTIPIIYGLSSNINCYNKLVDNMTFKSHQKLNEW